MSNSILSVPPPRNEAVRSYVPGSPEKASLKARLHAILAEEIEIPLLIGGREVRTGRTVAAPCPHDHAHRLAVCHQAGPEETALAISAALDAWREWSEMEWEARAAIF